MAYWLVKSEPHKYSWDMMVTDGRTHWDGVRNHQAAANLKAMQVGDRAFFYHSNEGKEIVGVVEIVRTAYPDPSDDAGSDGEFAGRYDDGYCRCKDAGLVSRFKQHCLFQKL